MPKSKTIDSDIFVRRPVLEMRDRLDRRKLLAEAHVANSEGFMEASIAAAMIIAHADGRADVAEYRRIISLFKAHPVLRAFSVDDIAREIEDHETAYATNADGALHRAREQIRHADLTEGQFDTLIDLCLEVLEADAIRDRGEEQALEEIRALRNVSRG